MNLPILPDDLSSSMAPLTPMLSRLSKTIMKYEKKVNTEKKEHPMILGMLMKSSFTSLPNSSVNFESVRSFLASRSLLCEMEYTKDHQQAVFALILNSKEDLSSIIYDLQITLTFLSERENLSLLCGLDHIKDKSDLTLPFEHIMNCLLLLNEITAIRGVCPYDNYTFIKMFGLLYKDNQSFVLDNIMLQTLLTKDRTDKTNYVHTIRTYLAENCNVTRAAARLFIHRHTLMNRLDTIKSLCNVDFDDYYTRLYLSIALLVHDYYAF